MIDTQTIIADLRETIAALEALQAGNEMGAAVIIAKASAKLATTSAQAVPSVIPESLPNIDVLGPIKNILGDIQDDSGYFNKVTDFIGKAQTLTTEEDLVKLIVSEVVDTNWSLSIDINADGKSVSLINGSEVINLAKNLIDGKPLDVQTAMLGIATKLEKEIFGFSVVETVKSLDSLSQILLSNSPADVKLTSAINNITGMVNTIGGERLSPSLKGVMVLVGDLNTKRVEAKALMEDAVKEFEANKALLLSGVLPELPPIVIPDEIIVPPILGEDPILQPPNSPLEEILPTDENTDSELLESASDFEDGLSETDEDYF